MRRRPGILVILAAYFLLMALARMALLLLEPAPVLLLWKAAAVLSALLAGILLFQGSRVLFLAVPVLLFAAFKSGWGVWGGVAVALPLCLLAVPAVWKVFKDPGCRWWFTPARKRLTLGTRVCPVTGGEIFSQTVDVSEGGAFISLEHLASRTDILPRIGIGTHCSVRLNLNQYASIACSARVVRINEARGSYPRGFAVRFIGLTREQQRYLATYLEVPAVTKLAS